MQRLSQELLLYKVLSFTTGVPNLWPAGQRWPVKHLEVALDLLKNFFKIYMKN